MKNIAIIPARSGSKGLKNKNIKLLDGKPLLAYTIEAAIKSKCFDVVFVSTDSKKYADIARKYGAEVPFFRSKKNSNDESTTWDVVRETLDSFRKIGKEFDTFMILQPTSPLRTYKDIQNSYKLLKNKRANAIVSTCEVSENPTIMYPIKKDLLLSNLVDFTKATRRQDFKKYYRLNGAIYLSKISYFEKYKNIYKSECYSYIMNKKSSIDIDDELDFIFVENLLK